MFFKRQLPVLIMMTIGLLTLFANFIRSESVSGWVKDDSLLWFGIIAAFAIILGAVNLLKIHFSKISQNKADYPYSIILIMGFVLMIFAGFFYHGVDRLGNGKYDIGEKFKDIGDGKWSDAEQFTDSNKNDKWDSAEQFTDIGDGKWGETERFKDENKNGKYDIGEKFKDVGDGKWSDAEQFTDSNKNDKWDSNEQFIDSNKNDKWDSAEQFTDIGDGKWSDAEEFTDSNKNSKWDRGEEFTDIGDGKWSDAEQFTDSNKNDKWDSAEQFTDKNNNVKYDKGEEFVDIGNGSYDKGEKFKDDDWGSHLFDVEGTLFSQLFNAIVDPLESTMFALLAFFVASASYRAFRIRNFEASLLLASGILVMIGAVPFGSYVPSWVFAYILLSFLFAFISPLFKDKRTLWISFFSSLVFISVLMAIWYPHFLTSKSILFWILAYPTRAGKTAIIIGVALGIAATSLRIIFGKDKSFLGD